MARKLIYSERVNLWLTAEMCERLADTLRHGEKLADAIRAAIAREIEAREQVRMLEGENI